MPKFFVTSDIHSYLAPLKIALAEAGFDPTDENHWLVVCGDAFDRGDDSVEVLRYLMSLERKVLIKGNHDTLFEELCDRGFAYSSDKTNGTMKTVYHLGGVELGYTFDKCCQRAWDRTAAYRDSLVNYFETENYVFVHSWIPLTAEDWRDATDAQWEHAMWDNPFTKAELLLNHTGKTIVFGHWHCSAGHKILGNCIDEFDHANWEPCYFKNNTIGIDRCTAYTGECNVLVIEDEFLH